ncbi:putative type VI secretion system effector [Brenneria goodwinii]|uniref:putative type VI secretion system effector n=1 Tax=Brenneria goodwinii TaxID=1109412 RepID=UPI0036E9C674
MRNEKVIDPKELHQQLFEAKFNVKYTRRQLDIHDDSYNSRVTEADLVRAEQHYQQVLSAWQELPPPPVLPPRGKLEKITGRLEAFSRIRCKANFDPDVYATSSDRTLTPGEKGMAGAAAIAIGSPALAGLALKGEETVLDDADYVAGMINGKPFAGWVGFTHLAVGDEVELAAEWQDDHYEVYAVAVSAARIVSICPECNHGRYIDALFRAKLGTFMTLLMFIVFSSIGFFMGEGTFWENLLNSVMNGHGRFYQGTTLMLVLGCALWGLFFYSAYKAYAKTTCKLAEEIFQVFGWRNPKWISLKKITARREKELKRQGEWYSPEDTSKPPRPCAQFIWSRESWYYY